MAKRNKYRRQVLPFKSVNYILFVIGIIMIAMGFVLLHSGSMTLAPLILVLAYCVVIPLAIMWGARHDEDPISSKKN
ncbi:MAG: hypothetical protein ACLFSQ_08210 [Candidatus Zixiibacteriota bacterium]